MRDVTDSARTLRKLPHGCCRGQFPGCLFPAGDLLPEAGSVLPGVLGREGIPWQEGDGVFGGWGSAELLSGAAVLSYKAARVCWRAAREGRCPSLSCLSCHTSPSLTSISTIKLFVTTGVGLEVQRLAVKHTITESQHSRGWQGPLWVTQPTPLAKQGHPQQTAQHRGQEGLEYLQRRRLHSLPGQPGPGLCHPQREEVLPHVQTEHVQWLKTSQHMALATSQRSSRIGLLVLPCSGSSPAAPKAMEGSRQQGCRFARRDLASATGTKGGEQSQVTHAKMENHRACPG